MKKDAMTVMITMTMMMRMKIRTVVTTMMMLMMMANKMILICHLLHWKSWFRTGPVGFPLAPKPLFLAGPEECVCRVVVGTGAMIVLLILVLYLKDDVKRKRL